MIHENMVRQIWDTIPMPDTVIARVNALGQGQHNDIDLLYCKKRPIRELDITVLDARET